MSGNLNLSTGSFAAGNPFRFSGEYHNNTTGLAEYTCRKYDPVMGRLIKRDPLGERGGINLYCLLINSPTNNFDKYGLAGGALVQYARRKIKSHPISLTIDAGNLTKKFPPVINEIIICLLCPRGYIRRCQQDVRDHR